MLFITSNYDREVWVETVHNPLRDYYKAQRPSSNANRIIQDFDRNANPLQWQDLIEPADHAA